MPAPPPVAPQQTVLRTRVKISGVVRLEDGRINASFPHQFEVIKEGVDRPRSRMLVECGYETAEYAEVEQPLEKPVPFTFR